jgi:hypothetical protein
VATAVTPEVSAPGALQQDQPTAAPAANSARGGSSGAGGLIAGAIVLALLIGAGVLLVRRWRGRSTH